MNQMLLSNMQQLNPASVGLQSQGINTATALLGGQPLPGYLSGLPGGITSEQNQSMTNETMKQLMPQFQQGGVLNSGAAASVAGNTMASLRNQNAQFNLQNLQQLLNIGVGGQAAPLQVGSSQLGQLNSSLQGLRSFNQFGNTTNTQLGQNPFYASFQQGAGSSMGNGLGNAFWGQ